MPREIRADERTEFLEDVFVVDTDVHVAEPPGEIKRYIEAPWDRMLEKFDDDGYRLRDTKGYMPGMEIGSPWIHSEYEYPALTSGEQTVADLDELAVDVGLLFPENFLKLPVIPDVDYANALARAYNDYILDRFLDETDRLVGAALVAPQDPVAAAEEIDRLGDEPAIKTVFLSVAGIDRTYGHPAYDPIWKAARDSDLPVSFHSAGIDYPEFPFNTHKLPFLVRHTLNHELSLQVNALDIVARGVVERYPELEFGFFEGGLSWVPMATHRLDREYMQHREEVPHLTKRPSEYIKDFYIGTHPLETPADNRDFDRLTGLLGGTDRLLFATDWPHHDFDHPADVRKFGGDESRRRIWGENARRFLDL